MAANTFGALGSLLMDPGAWKALVVVEKPAVNCLREERGGDRKLNWDDQP